MDFIIDLLLEIVTSAEILIGLVAFIGLLVQKKPLAEIITGTTKTIIGILILGAGAGVLASSLAYLSPLIKEAFNVEGLAPLTDAYVPIVLEELGAITSYIIIGSFLVNLLLARFTKFKYIFLAGHCILYFAVVMAVVLTANEVYGLPAVIIGSLFAGFLMTILPAINQKYMDKITGGEKMAMGHSGATGYWLAGFVGKYVGDPEDSTETMKLPKSLSFAKETIVAATLVIVIIFAICVAFTGADFLETEFGVTQNVVIFVIMQGLTFGAGLTILMQGVRMMISEILTAFEGIATKIVPNAIPALDCPVVFPYAPNAVLIGFVSATISGIVASLIFSQIVGIAIIPPVMEFFFMGGAAGVYGNSTGGRKGAIVGGAIQGILFTVLPYFFWLETRSVVAAGAITVTDTDLALSGVILDKILQIFK